MDYTVKLLEEVRHRYLLYMELNNPLSSGKPVEVTTLLDTGAFN